MALISNSDLSNFPYAIDSFSTAVDGLTVTSTIEASRWNKIEAAIYRLETHLQKTVHFLNGADRKLVRLDTVVSVGSTTGSYYVDFQLTPEQKLLLNSQPFAFSNMIFADVYSYGGTREFFADIHPIEPDRIRVRFKRLDPSQTIPADTYHVRVSFLGL